VLRPDRFKEQADRKAARAGVQPRSDAFAGDGATRAAPVDAFRNRANARPRAAAMKASAPAPAAPAVKSKERRAALHVVASQPEVEPVERVERQETRRAKPAAKPSSLVLVSSASAVAAAEAPAETGPPDELEMPRLGQREDRPRSGSGGGGGGGVGGGGGRSSSGPPRDSILNQDDLVSVLMVIVMLILLLLYLIRPGGQGAAVDDRLINTQFAAAQPEAPPAPRPDPFGDAPVDLTPKSPLPPTPEAVLAAPAPAAAPVVITMHAWFCTAKSDLTPATMAALDKQVADWGPKLTSRELVVRGYADTRGTSDFNLSLGGARAAAVADYLRSKGVKVADTSGVGELPDLADNQNCSNQRRVDVRLSDMPDEAPDRSCAPPEAFAELMCG
jgi:outer membrane protein OmpA-like peptidoglycan-associated protein